MHLPFTTDPVSEKYCYNFPNDFLGTSGETAANAGEHKNGHKMTVMYSQNVPY